MSTSEASTGNERFIADKRQFAGLMFGLAICATFQPLADIASLIGPDGTTASSGVPLSALVSGLCLVLIGTTGMFTGYTSLVLDWGSPYLTGFLMIITQLAFIPYFTLMTNIGMGIRTDPALNPFIPSAYEPTHNDVRFVGVMGIIAVLAYATSFIGSLAFMEFALYSYQVGKPSNRSSSYYRGRLPFYAFLLILAGLSQLMLGSYILSNFGNGPLENGAIGVAVYVVNFPELSIFVGLVQLLNGLFGLARFFGVSGGKNDHSFQITMFMQWVFMLTMQIMAQISYAPAGAFATAAPTVACLSVGLNVVPAFLDYKMRTTPLVIDENYYGFTPSEGTTVKQADDDVEEDVKV